MSPRSLHRPSKARRRFAAAVLAIVGISGFGIASAAQLNLSSSAISAGSTLITSCQTSGTIAVTFPAAWTTTPTSAYRVASVAMTNVSTTCNGKPYRLQLLTTAGVALGNEVTGTSLTVVSGAVTIPVGAQLASDVGGVALVIQG